ncbi:MAG: transglutaminase family protein, partial [Cyanobacteriota bacterium]|nr:transglutaminase family protein [Cyanobacteriota bacterium]
MIRWGTMLHDRFFLPHYIAEDLQKVIGDLRSAGFDIESGYTVYVYNSIHTSILNPPSPHLPISPSPHLPISPS